MNSCFEACNRAACGVYADRVNPGAHAATCMRMHAAHAAARYLLPAEMPVLCWGQPADLFC